MPKHRNRYWTHAAASAAELECAEDEADARREEAEKCIDGPVCKSAPAPEARSQVAIPRPEVPVTKAGPHPVQLLLKL